MAFTAAVPIAVPKQRLFVCDVIEVFNAADGPDIVTDAIELRVHPFASLTVTLCMPVERLVAVVFV